MDEKLRRLLTATVDDLEQLKYYTSLGIDIREQCEKLAEKLETVLEIAGGKSSYI